MKTDKEEELIKVLKLEVVEDIKILGFKVYGLKTGKRILGVVLNDKFEILSIEEHNKFKRLFKSASNTVNDLDDFKIILNYLLDWDEIKVINKLYSQRK